MKSRNRVRVFRRNRYHSVLRRNASFLDNFSKLADIDQETKKALSAYQETKKALSAPEVRERLQGLGAEPGGTTP